MNSRVIAALSALGTRNATRSYRAQARSAATKAIPKKIMAPPPPTLGLLRFLAAALHALQVLVGRLEKVRARFHGAGEVGLGPIAVAAQQGRVADIVQDDRHFRARSPGEGFAILAL